MEAKLDGVFAQSWEKLQQAKQGKAGSRYITVCNFAKGYPNAYTVVLREALPNENQIIFHTDIRSEKVNEIKSNSSITIVYYDDADYIQIILKAEATIHYQDDIARQQWQQSGFKSRRNYLTQQAPSSPLNEEGNGLEYLGDKKFDDNDASGYENFAVVVLTINFLEYLQLNKEGNRRARFKVDQKNIWMGEWVTP
ncbi:pyridoxamine 5'-phosphate oxidase family protein [Mucilaginibacter sp. CSA2-8R]|uniref:pyridoxamine 5'-phosphate oxidase family protein n=1 Tax=Mucilaginibacter sp. CSA2-8R TaxID=3141542 RepID=UPI00315C570E